MLPNLLCRTTKIIDDLLPARGISHACFNFLLLWFEEHGPERGQRERSRLGATEAVHQGERRPAGGGACLLHARARERDNQIPR